MILDATSGNRTMWEWKDSEYIVYIDIQRRLEIPPTLFCDNTKTPFPNGMFHTIFYDPPHKWGDPKSFYSFPELESYQTVYKDAQRLPTYYGWEMYKTRRALLRHIYNAQKEFARITKSDGLLWLKWNEVEIPLKNVLSVFMEWQMILQLPISDPRQTAGKKQTYWVCMQRKKEIRVQQPLLAFPLDN